MDDETDDEPTQSEQELYSAVFPLIDRTYMMKESFKTFINDKELVQQLPPLYAEQIDAIQTRLETLYSSFGLLLFGDSEEEQLLAN